MPGHSVIFSIRHARPRHLVAGSKRIARIRSYAFRVESRLEDKMSLSGKEFVEQFDSGQIPDEESGKCADCARPLQETVTGSRWTAHGHVCSDCYFKALGAWVADHPIEPFVPQEIEPLADE
jgi:hypothetical protein